MGAKCVRSELPALKEEQARVVLEFGVKDPTSTPLFGAIKQD
jgi:hypothetical protein